MKMRTLITAVPVFALAIAIQANAGTVTSKGDDLVLSTNSGLKIETADGDRSFAIGGRIMWDYANIDVNGDNVVNDTYIRRARIHLKGHTGDWAYKSQLNLDDDRGNVKRKGGTVEDLYITYKGFGSAAHITAGKHNAPFSLQQLNSSNDMSALERSASTNLFAAGRHTGIQFHGKSGIFTYGIGAYESDKEFLDSDDDFIDRADDDASSLSVVGRLTATPINEDGNVLHLGAGFIEASDDSQNFRLKDVYNLEAAAVVGPYHVQAEYYDGTIGRQNGTNVDTYYIQAGWVLTGESRPYKGGKFKRIKPKADSGAWELVARYNDGNGDFDEIGDVDAKSYLVGVNYYASKNVRIGINYSTIEEADTNNDADVFLARVQYVLD
jgi:phosphate-selective porin OprO/OprP